MALTFHGCCGPAANDLVYDFNATPAPTLEAGLLRVIKRLQEQARKASRT